MFPHYYGQDHGHGPINYGTNRIPNGQINDESATGMSQSHTQARTQAHQLRARATTDSGIFPLAFPTTPAISDTIIHNIFADTYRYPPKLADQTNISPTPDRQLASVNGIDITSRGVNPASTSHDGGVASIKSPSVYSNNGNVNGRKRDASTAGLDTSPQSIDHSGDTPPPSAGYDTNGHTIEELSARKRPVKRACNECRQQKLRCDVIQEPFKVCTRCTRLNLECKIEENFKRIGKRSRNAEMEREIVELRKQVAAQTSAGQGAHPLNHSTQHTNEAAAGLLDLRDGRGGHLRRLGDIALTQDRIQQGFSRFFKFSHPFLPFLNPERTPDQYYADSPLLFWTIVLTGSRHNSADPNLFPSLARQVQELTWRTIAEVPQNYHMIKALVLLCAWPLPCNSTSTDPTFMLAGMMIQIALQIGLHRPDHAQDFSKFRIELRQADLQDRVVTWSVCNMVAQRIATAYGQPAQTTYDWTLGPRPIESHPSYELPPEIYNRLQIERFADKVSKTIYTNSSDPVGLPEDDVRSELVKLLAQDYRELEERINHGREEPDPITNIYLKAALLHLRLSAFFSHRNLYSYRTDMLDLYHATRDFLEVCLALENSVTVDHQNSYTHGLSLSHGTNYLFHMMLAAGFSLLKIMQYFLPQHNLDTQGASTLLHRTLWALRSTSVVENDLPERLSEVLAQVWKSGKVPDHDNGGKSEEPSDELQLRVRCRMSMSLVFDSVWRWRKNFRDLRPPPSRFFTATGEGAPTDPTLPKLESNNNTHLNTPILSRTPVHGSTSNANANLPTLNSSSAATPVPGMAGMPTGIADDFAIDPYNASNSYEVFDPLNWMLDGTVDFPFNFPPAGNDAGMKFLGQDL